MGYQEGGHMTSCLKGLFLNGDGTYLNLPNQKMRNISGMLELVFESPVRSGYWVPRGSNRDRDRLAFVPRPKIT
jgi:hypothetical protein